MLAFYGSAQDVNFYATVDKNPVAVNDVFTYTLTLENGRGDIIPPKLSDFNVVFGPSRSSNYRIINGRQSSSITLSYTMRATSIGEFTIDPGRAQADGKTYETEALSIKVINGRSSAAAQRSQSNSGSSASGSESSNDENLKVQILLSKRKAYLGEQIVATYVVLTRYKNIDVDETKFPSLAGFWTEDLKNEQATWERELEIINGVAYRKAVLKRQILFPQRTGKIKIDPLAISARVNRSFFNAGTALRVNSNSPQLEVEALPSGAPPSYTGAVGDFQFSVDLDRQELKANEAITMKIAISGQGNLTLIDEPELSFPADFEAYDPETSDRINVSGGGVSGSRSFQYLLIPRYPGEYEIPKISFTFFNPRSAQFERRSAGPFAIKVGGGDVVATTAGAQRSQNVVEESANDIRYILTDASRLEPKGALFFKSIPYFIILCIPFLALIIFLLLRKKRRSDLSDAAGYKQRKASKMARRRLKKSEAALRANDSTKFYAEIYQALYGYLSDKLGIPVSNLTRILINEKLRQKDVEEPLLAELSKIMDTCEMARFSPMNNADEKGFYDESVRLIQKLDQKIR